MIATQEKTKTLDVKQKLEVTYCVAGSLRDQQILLATARKGLGRIEPTYEKRTESVAIVCFGPSLNDTWEKIRDFKYIITCSGSHKFLVEHGIIPTWHVEVDPRRHKVELIGPPHRDVEYLIASACHPAVFDHLNGYNVKLWHVFNTEEEGMRILPHGEWALMGGSSVGLRTLSIARFIGFTDMHIFGMDGNEGASGKHADKHPNQPPGHAITTYDGVDYKTTPALLECARQTFKELDEMPDVKATFYGEGMVQAMAKTWERNPKKNKVDLAFAKPELISVAHRELNRRMHREEPAFGIHASKFSPVILKLSEALKTTSILDYGCGKGFLGRELPFPIWEYDPAIPGKEASPRPADIVACLDVLEHVEPEKIDFVLADIQRCTKKVGYFVVNLGSARKTYADGSNTHLIQNDKEWWESKISTYFKIGSARSILICPAERAWDKVDHHEVHFVVEPKPITLTKVRQ